MSIYCLSQAKVLFTMVLLSLSSAACRVELGLQVVCVGLRQEGPSPARLLCRLSLVCNEGAATVRLNYLLHGKSSRLNVFSQIHLVDIIFKRGPLSKRLLEVSFGKHKSKDFLGLRVMVVKASLHASFHISKKHSLASHLAYVRP